MSGILIVEDDGNKRTAVLNFVRERFGDREIFTAHSLQSGLKSLREKNPSLVILDMTLPNYDQGPEEDGGIIHPLGGQEFLRKMRRKKIEVPVVVLTQFETFGTGPQRLEIDTLGKALEDRFGGLCVATIYYNSAVDTWKNSLNSVMETVLNIQTP